MRKNYITLLFETGDDVLINNEQRGVPCHIYEKKMWALCMAV